MHLNLALNLKNETDFQSPLVYRHLLSIFKGCLHGKNDGGKCLFLGLYQSESSHK